MQRRLTAGETLRRCRHAAHFRTQGIAHPHAARQSIREPAGDAPGKAREHPVGQPGNRILFMDDQWAAQQRRHHAAGKADVATHAQNHVGSDAANFTPRLPARGEQVKGQQQLAQQTLAAQRGEAHPGHFIAARRNQLRLQTVRRPHPDDAPVTAFQQVSHRQTRKHVATGAAGHHQQGPVHAATLLIPSLHASTGGFPSRFAAAPPAPRSWRESPNRRSSSRAGSIPWSAADPCSRPC